jgi:hypothetical protein
MPTTAWIPAAGVMSMGSGSAWLNPSNAGGAADGAYAEHVSTASVSGHFLLPVSSQTNFLGLIPAGGTPTGAEIRVTIAAGGGTATPSKTLAIALLGGFTPVGVPKEVAVSSLDAGGQFLFGGAADQWGLNASGWTSFLSNGAAAVFISNGTNANAARVDAIELRVHYTLPAVPALVANHALRVGVGLGL